MKNQIRIRFLKAGFLIWGLLLFCRLFYIQVWKHTEYRETALNQYFTSTIISAPRGDIIASDGFPLATDTQNYLTYIQPNIFHPTSQEVEQLLTILPSSESARKIISRPYDSNISWVSLSRGLSVDQKIQLERLNIEGLNFQSEPGRVYPEGSSSAYLTGFVGQNDQGLPQGYFGLEGYYDRLLSGKPGRIYEQTDALRKTIVIGDRNLVSVRPGADLITSIDRTIQFIAAQKLEEGLNKYQAVSGTITVLETQTGKVLAMVSLPGYNQVGYSQYSPFLYKNPIVSEGYEPGSTFKTIIMASALDAGVVKPDTICTACNSAQIISGEQVKNYNDKYYPETTMNDIILHSDNVGMVFVGRLLGKDKMISYLKKFGFGQLTGIDLQEEDTPSLRPDSDWYDIDLATTSFGQGIAVTRLQMVAAFNAIANGGKYLSPKIVVAIKESDRFKEITPPQPRQIISPDSASKMTQMMLNGVENGEVRYYRLKDYRIAGKTGTAQIPIAGHYDPDKGIASFIAFAPVPNPKITMLVTLQDPKTSPWGSTTAAPLWFNIAREILRYYRL